MTLKKDEIELNELNVEIGVLWTLITFLVAAGVAIISLALALIEKIMPINLWLFVALLVSGYVLLFLGCLFVIRLAKSYVEKNKVLARFGIKKSNQLNKIFITPVSRPDYVVAALAALFLVCLIARLIIKN